MTQNELMHYGKKGMRWGKRMAPRPTQAHLSIGKNVSDNARPGVDAIRNTSNVVSRNKSTNKSKSQSRKMTNAELQEKIQRMSLEQQYANLSANQISKGRANVDTAMQVAGGVLAVTSSALGIAVAIKSLKG